MSTPLQPWMRPEVLTALLENVSDGLVLLDDQERLQAFNVKAQAWLGLKTEDIGRPWTEVLEKHPQMYLAYRQLKAQHDVFEATVAGGQPNTLEMHLVPLASGTLILLKDVTLLRDAALRIRQAETYLDRQIKEIEDIWQRLVQEIYRDALTGVYNRRYLEEKLWEEINRARRLGEPLGVLMLDVDGLKYWNDQHGHLSGDMLLISVARILQQVFHPFPVTRYGGDEFVVLLPGATPESVEERFMRLEDMLQRAWPAPFRGKICSLSGGLAFYPWHGHDPQALLKAADAALYQTKRQGKGFLTLADYTRAKALNQVSPSQEGR